ncbi:MAG: Smr/MutS family protein [Micavibrio sp.]
MARGEKGRKGGGGDGPDGAGAAGRESGRGTGGRKAGGKHKAGSDKADGKNGRKDDGKNSHGASAYSPGQKSGKAPSEDDLSLWRRYARDIEPLKQPARLAPAPKPRGKKPPFEATPAGVPADLEAVKEGLGAGARGKAKARAAEQEGAGIWTPPQGAAKGHQVPPSGQLDRRTDQKLRRGKINVEATLDLHGYSQERAYVRLCSFVEQAYRREYRCILVITGKGRMKEGKSGVLEPGGIIRGRLKDWLAMPPLSGIVLKSQLAAAKDGGGGAFYLYLRRKRQNNP